METENMCENARAKLKSKKPDMIVGNNVKVEGAGFAGDTNVLTIITEKSELKLELMSKFDCADKLLDEIIKIRAGE